MAKGGNKRRLTARRCSRKRLTSKFRGNQYKKKKIQETVGNISECLTDVDNSNEIFLSLWLFQKLLMI